jgi:phosphonopyruvate decarboxylase
MSDHASAERMIGALDRAGYGFATGVPCSHLATVIDDFTRRGKYLAAVNEGAAVAVAAGAELAGRRTVVLLQNSGLGNAVNPLASLALPFGVAVLLLVSLRGWPDADADEPQHSVMGPATAPVLAALGIEHAVLTEDGPEVLLERAERARATGRPFAVLVPRGALGRTSRPAFGGEWTARQAVEVVARRVRPHSAVLSTTGFLSRDSFAVADRPLSFFMQGAMGHLASLGLGVALARPERPVVLIDGDGAALMHLGALAGIGAARPVNLTHVVVDNGCYESTGGQGTISAGVDWAGLARAMSYRTAAVCASEDALAQALDRCADQPGPHLVVAKVGPRAGEPPPRATATLSPVDLTHRFRDALAVPAAGRGA